jgi:hypothetical protein
MMFAIPPSHLFQMLYPYALKVEGFGACQVSTFNGSLLGCIYPDVQVTMDVII